MANSPFPVLRKEVQNYLRSCEQEERERVAAEALLKIGDLTDAEIEAALNRLSKKLINSR